MLHSPSFFCVVFLENFLPFIISPSQRSDSSDFFLATFRPRAVQNDCVVMWSLKKSNSTTLLLPTALLGSEKKCKQTSSLGIRVVFQDPLGVNAESL